MKTITTLAVAVALMASCSKAEFQDVDVLVNQGQSEVILNGITLSPGEEKIVDHTSQYFIECGDECKVNINGYIMYETGLYDMDIKRKQKI